MNAAPVGHSPQAKVNRKPAEQRSAEHGMLCTTIAKLTERSETGFDRAAQKVLAFLQCL